MAYCHLGRDIPGWQHILTDMFLSEPSKMLSFKVRDGKNLDRPLLSYARRHDTHYYKTIKILSSSDYSTLHQSISNELRLREIGSFFRRMDVWHRVLTCVTYLTVIQRFAEVFQSQLYNIPHTIMSVFNTVRLLRLFNCRVFQRDVFKNSPTFVVPV